MNRDIKNLIFLSSSPYGVLNYPYRSITSLCSCDFNSLNIYTYYPNSRDIRVAAPSRSCAFYRNHYNQLLRNDYASIQTPDHLEFIQMLHMISLYFVNILDHLSHTISKNHNQLTIFYWIKTSYKFISLGIRGESTLSKVNCSS